MTEANRKVTFEEKIEAVLYFSETKSYSIQSVCSILELNRSSYYKWLQTRKSPKQLEDEKLVESIKNLEKRHGYKSH